MTSTKPHTSTCFQTTLKEKLTFSGPSVFSNQISNLTLHPADADEGIAFYIDGVKIPATAEHAVSQGAGFTTLFNGDKKVQMVEHLLSALCGCEIDNVRIDLDHFELPMLDGSARPYVEAFKQSGIFKLQEKRLVYTLSKPVYFSDGGAALVALPADTFQVSYTWHYPTSEAFKSLFFSQEISADSYAEKVAPARTFAFYEDIAPAIEAGLIKGANLNQGILIQDDQVVNQEGLRFSDELVRHKVLDIIGDFALVGKRLNAHILALCSGHQANVQFAQKVRQLLIGEHTDGTTIRQADFGRESSCQNSSPQVSISSR